MSRPALADPMIGSVIGERYEVVRRIAKGGMGTIYEVRNTRLGRSFALKMLTAEAAEDPEMLLRFRREADVVAQLRHPNIVEVVDWDSLDDGLPYLVMEYLRGEPLAMRLRAQKALGWESIGEIGDQVLAALSVAHRAGVVHRDLKPENIFLALDDAGREHVKLLDFGISKLRDSKTFATTDARVLGTPAYMAPEQAEGRHDLIGPGTDVWAMGAILYEMVTGAVAFEAPSTPAILYRVCHGEPDPLRGRRPDAPPALIALIARTLTRDIAERPSSVDALRGELAAALEPGAEAPAVAARSTLPVAPRRRVRWPFVALLLAVAVAAAAFLVLPMYASSSEVAPEPAPRPTPVPAPRPTPVPLPPLPPAPPPPTPASVVVGITSRPSGATIYRLPKMVRVGTTPFLEHWPSENGGADFELHLDGFEPFKLSIDLRTGGKQAAELVKSPRRRPAGPQPPQSPPARRKGTPVNPY
jgi:serine/threonine protein kinase